MTAVTELAEAPFLEALRALPKVELHCHVEGTMRPETVAALARKNGVPLPAGDVRDLYRYGSLDEFLKVFWLVQSVLADRDDWARLGYESVLDGAAAGRVYAEVFVTPARHLAAGQTLRSVLEGLSAGLAAGDAETGCLTRVIVDMDRAYGGEAGLQLMTELIELRRAGAPGTDRVIGIGMDSTELNVDPLSFAPAYREAAAAGLRRTGHQGENSPAAAVGVVAVGLGAERIDHGLSLIEDPDLVAFFADRRIPLTMCPTSNVVIANTYSSVDRHPLPALREAGVLVTINTDDPALTDLDLAREYATCAAAWNWSWDQMVQISLDGVEATWLDDSDKRALSGRVRAAADRINPAPRLAVGGVGHVREEQRLAGRLGGDQHEVRAVEREDDRVELRRGGGDPGGGSRGADRPLLGDLERRRLLDERQLARARGQPGEVGRTRERLAHAKLLKHGLHVTDGPARAQVRLRQVDLRRLPEGRRGS
jgi:adenosine deaminase